MEEKKVTWLELFFDLVFVTAVSYTTHLFVQIEHHPDNFWFYFGEYLLMVFPMFWLWAGQSMFFNRFSEHLRNPELFMLPQMFFFILMTASLGFEFSSTYHSFLAGYLGVRILTIWQYYIVSKQQENQQKKATLLLTKILSIGIIIPALSILIDSYWHFIIMYVGIFIDMLLPILYRNQLSKVSVNMPHITERLGLFVLITFGESLVAITNILKDHTTEQETVFYACVSFILICTLWSSYFFPFEKTIDRKVQTNGQIILYGHFFVLLAIMMLAGTIELLHQNVLPQAILLAFLYGSISLFYISTRIIFYLHRKKESSYLKKENLIIVFFFVFMYTINLYMNIDLGINLLIATIACLVHFILQVKPRLR